MLNIWQNETKYITNISSNNNLCYTVLTSISFYYASNKKKIYKYIYKK